MPDDPLTGIISSAVPARYALDSYYLAKAILKGLEESGHIIIAKPTFQLELFEDGEINWQSSEMDYAVWSPGDDVIVMDGCFTIDELMAIALHMRQHRK